MGSDIKLNDRGMEDLLKSPGVQEDLRRRAERIAAAAGFGYRATVSVGRNRARATVVTATFAARRDNARRNTLLRALDAGRG